MRTVLPTVEVRLLQASEPIGRLELQSLLSPDEDVRLRRFTSASAAQHFLLGRALIRLTLSELADVRPCDWRFEFNAFGRPNIGGPVMLDLNFSLSHSHRLVALALATGGKVGLDVEGYERTVAYDDLATSVLGTRELARFQRKGGGRDLFLKYWTLKEAYLKACGDGLNGDVRQVEFDIEASLPRLLPPAAGLASSTPWWFESYQPDDEHLIAIAVKPELPLALSMDRFTVRNDWYSLVAVAGRPGLRRDSYSS